MALTYAQQQAQRFGITPKPAVAAPKPVPTQQTYAQQVAQRLGVPVAASAPAPVVPTQQQYAQQVAQQLGITPAPTWGTTATTPAPANTGGMTSQELWLMGIPNPGPWYGDTSTPQAAAATKAFGAGTAPVPAGWTNPGGTPYGPKPQATTPAATTPAATTPAATTPAATTPTATTNPNEIPGWEQIGAPTQAGAPAGVQMVMPMFDQAGQFTGYSTQAGNWGNAANMAMYYPASGMTR